MLTRLERSFLGALLMLGGKARQIEIINELRRSHQGTYRRTSIMRVGHSLADKGEIIKALRGWYYLPEIWRKEPMSHAFAQLPHGRSVNTAILLYVWNFRKPVAYWRILKHCTLDGEPIAAGTINSKLSRLTTTGYLERTARGFYVVTTKTDEAFRNAFATT